MTTGNIEPSSSLNIFLIHLFQTFLPVCTAPFGTRGWRYAPFLLSGLMSLVIAPVAQACEDATRVRLTEPVAFSAQQLAEFRALPPLRVVAVNAPPMARYDEDHHTYSGVAIDVLCFIAQELGLHYDILPERNITVADKIAMVQSGRADLFLPLSLTPERAAGGVFTQPYYDSYYAVIARKGRRLAVTSLADLSRLRVGVVKGVAFESVLRNIVPATRLIAYDLTSSDGLFRALQEGEIDVAVFNRNIFTEKRFQHDYFNLEVVHTIHEFPRGYRFYLSPSPAHQRLAAAFDRYLAVMDVSRSVAEHEDGERILIDRYVAERSQRLLLQAGLAAAALLALIFFIFTRRYRRLARQLAGRNRQVEAQQRELQTAYQTLERQSQKDGLTQLANRVHFDQVLAHEHARQQRSHLPLSLLIADVDHFKCVNDHYGHLVGDDYLRAVARVMAASVSRASDLVARFGGEEFACLLPGTAAADAQLLAQRIVDAVDALDLPNALAGTGRLTISIGLVTLVAPGMTVHELVDQADAQLYAAKHAGRHCIRSVELGLDATQTVGG